MFQLETPLTPLPGDAQEIVVDGRLRPVHNALGQPIHATTEGVRNFWRWFGDSLVVDAQGRPAVLFHGTNQVFDAFDATFIGTRFNFSLGHHFTTRPTEAGIYAFGMDFDRRPDPGGHILPAYVKAHRPLDLLTTRLTASMEADLGREAIVTALESARTQGQPYDGVLIRRERGDEWDGWNVIVFRANQIKSALGNSGRFDPDCDSFLDESEAACVAIDDIRPRASYSSSFSVPAPSF